MKIKFLAGSLAFLAFAMVARADGTLYAATDDFAFGGSSTGQIAVTSITGITPGSTSLVNTDFPINGIGPAAGGLLYGGAPLDNLMRTVNPSTGATVTSVTGGFLAGDSVNHFDVNEQFAFDGTTLYHVHWGRTSSDPGSIQQLNPITGAVIATDLQTQMVGIVFVGNQLWISSFGGKSVGTFDFASNTYTPVFTLGALGGGLAYDSGTGTLWVGEQGGMVIPYSLTGTPLGPGFQPFGPTGGDVVDGLTFIPSQTPEPGTWILLGSGLVGVFRSVRRRMSA